MLQSSLLITGRRDGTVLGHVTRGCVGLSACLWVVSSLLPSKWSDLLSVETKMCKISEAGMPAVPRTAGFLVATVLRYVMLCYASVSSGPSVIVCLQISGNVYCVWCRAEHYQISRVSDI